jgi:hypothetical protein
MTKFKPLQNVWYCEKMVNNSTNINNKNNNPSPQAIEYKQTTSYEIWDPVYGLE